MRKVASSMKDPVVKVVTETGSVYHIDFERDVWCKNGGDVHDAIMDFRVGDREDGTDLSLWRETRQPEVGLSMFIHGKKLHDWWLTTTVISVEEIEREDSWV